MKLLIKISAWLTTIASGAYIGVQLGNGIGLAIAIFVASLNLIMWIKEQEQL